MRALNMLTQVHKTTVYGAAGDTLSCSQTDWYGHSTSTGTIYVPKYWAQGCGADLEWVASAADPDSYDDRGRLVKQSDGGGLTTRVFYGTESAPFTNSTANTRVTGIRRYGYGVGGANWGDDFEALALEERYSYDALGRIDTVYEANGRRAAFRYDGHGRLVEVENDAGETVTTHEYEYSSEVTGSYDPNRPNRVTTIQHGSANQASTGWVDGLGRPVGQTAYHDDNEDDVAITEYDGAGRPYRAWRPYRASAPGVRSPVGETWGGGLYRPPGMAIGQFGEQSSNYWGAQDFIPSNDAPHAYSETTYEQSPLGRPTFIRDPGSDGRGVTYRYGVDRPDAAFPGMRPEAPVDMAYVETEDADGYRTRTYTDGLGRERFVWRGHVTKPETSLTEMVYDGADRLVEVRHPTYFDPRPGDTQRTAHVTTYEYDTRGLLVETVSPDAGRTRMAYDRMGRLKYRQDADMAARSSGGRTFAHSFGYDALGRPTTEYIGDTTCSWEQVLAPGYCPSYSGASSNWEWDGAFLVRATRYDVGDGHTGWPHFADPSFAFTNPRGRPVVSTYYSDGKRYTESFAYDAEGRVSAREAWTDGVPNPSASFAYTYDRAGLVTDVTVEVGSQAFRQRQTYWASGQVHESYSGVGTAGVVVTTSQEARREYNAAGALYYTYFNGLTNTGSGTQDERRGYDIEGRLTHVSDPNSTAAPFREELTYSEGGLITAARFKAPASGSSSTTLSTHDANARLADWRYSFNYDGLGRLTSAYYGTPYYGVSSYDLSAVSYDANGNLLSLTRRAPTGSNGSAPVDQLTFGYDAGTNRLYHVLEGANKAAWASAAWDADQARFWQNANGALYRHRSYPHTATGVEKYEDRYVYRFDEQSLSLYETDKSWDETAQTYRTTYVWNRYDGAGRRVWHRTRVNGVDSDSRYLVEGGATVGVLDGSGSVLHWNTSVGRITGAGERFVYRRDHLGSVRTVQQASTGAVVEARDYYPFGLQMPGRTYVSGTPTREGFTGHELDQETGMNYAGARYYMPALGRFTSVDPLADHPNQRSLSPYNYAWNNPASLTDPTGLCPQCDDSDYMELSNNVYGVSEGDVTDSGWKAHWVYSNTDTGLKTAIYYKEIDGANQYIMAVAGTDPADVAGDWMNDVTQALLGSSEQYDQGIGFASTVVELGYDDISFAGHSLGGGIASTMALEVGGKAVTFNAAGLHPNMRARFGGTADITAHIVQGEAVDWAQSSIGLAAEGNRVYHPVLAGGDPWSRVPIMPGPIGVAQRGYLHTMAAVTRNVRL